jgi:FkbH-like protein
MFEGQSTTHNNRGAEKLRITQIKRDWREYQERLAFQKMEPTISIGLAASFTVNSLLPFLGAQLVEAGLKPAIEVGPYNQLFQICFDHQSLFKQEKNDGEPDIIILLFRLEDIVLEDLLACIQGETGAYQRAAEKVELLAAALRGLREKFKGTLITNIPPFPTGLPTAAASLDNPVGLGALHRSLTARFVDALAGIPGIRLCDFDAAQRDCGLSNSFDSRQWYLYRQPFTDSFLLRSGAWLARMIVSLRMPAKKCVVLDCDNTLWGGTVGEDGINNLQLGDEFPGTAFRDFQRLLLYWRGQGILLALSSKNNEADVWEVFEKHSGMLLKREHISAYQINWNPKSDNIIHIAGALNIGVDSLVFIDDNPMEIDYMRAARPEVSCVLVPEDPADILETMQSLTLFDRLEVTQEDRQRAELMRAEQQRAALSTSLSQDEFRKNLGLRIDFFGAQPEDLERIAQLINKTNQFNLTTIRRSVDEVRVLAHSLPHRIFGIRVSDKFGEYGLTGVVIAEMTPGSEEMTIDTFLLSCRVLGRGVETALLAALAEEARIEGAQNLVASFIATAKNAPAASFLPDHGFRMETEPRWRIAVSDLPALDPSITLIRRGVVQTTFASTASSIPN